jgi:hypothetical protein
MKCHSCVKADVYIYYDMLTDIPVVTIKEIDLNFMWFGEDIGAAMSIYQAVGISSLLTCKIKQEKGGC